MSAAFIVCGVVFIGFSLVGWLIVASSVLKDRTKDGGTYRTQPKEETK